MEVKDVLLRLRSRAVDDLDVSDVQHAPIEVDHALHCTGRLDEFLDRCVEDIDVVDLGNLEGATPSPGKMLRKAWVDSSS